MLLVYRVSFTVHVLCGDIAHFFDHYQILIAAIVDLWLIIILEHLGQ